MTALQSRLVVTGEQLTVRARVVTGAAGEAILELTQLHRRDDGMVADAARVFVALDRIEALNSAMMGLRADALNALAQSEGRNRLSPVSRQPKPSPPVKHTAEEW